MSKLRVVCVLLLAALGLTAAAPALQGGLTFTSIPLTQLGAENFAVLQGPFDEINLSFQIPANWQIDEGSTLNLSLQTFFSSFLPGQAELIQGALVAGHLSLYVDGTLVQRDVFNQNGEFEFSIPLSPAVLEPSNPNHQLSIRWDASASCDLNLSTALLIGPDSALTLTHSAATFNGDLSNLPFPFFTNNALEHPGTLIVLPASATELQVAAGLAVAAGLGRNSADAIVIITEDDLTAADLASHHLIFVGPDSAFSNLSGVTLPHDNNPRLSANQPGLGFVELSASPWNIGLGLMLVSGSGDDALLNAARQVGSGALVLNLDGDLAIVEGEAPAAAATADLPNASLAQLGQGDLSFERYGRSEISIPFYVTPGRAVSEQAYLDLRFAHSELVDYLRSGLSISLNGEPVSSVRLTDQSAARHSELILVSPTALQPGWNTLGITADVLPLDLCANEQEGQHWLTVYADSTLNLPTAENAPTASNSATFADLAPVFADQMQATTLIVSNEAADWSAAADMLRGLAVQTWPLLPQVAFVENAGSATGENLLIVGGPEDYAAIPSVDAGFLQAGANRSGQVTLSSGAQLSYAPGTNFGIIASRALPAGEGRSLAVLGNSPASLARAVSILLAPNFAVDNRDASLLVLQNETLIRDDGSQAATPSATEQAQTAGTTVPVSTGKGPYLYLILLLLLVGVGIVLWDQTYKYIKTRVQKKK